MNGPVYSLAHPMHGIGLRLGRDAVDVLTAIRRLGELEVKVIALQPGQLDLTSPAGRMMLTMLAAAAEMERDLLVERTRAGLERVRAEGKKLGRPSKTTHKTRADLVKAHSRGRDHQCLGEAVRRVQGDSAQHRHAAVTLQISAA